MSASGFVKHTCGADKSHRLTREEGVEHPTRTAWYYEFNDADVSVRDDVRQASKRDCWSWDARRGWKERESYERGRSLWLSYSNAPVESFSKWISANDNVSQQLVTNIIIADRDMFVSMRGTFSFTLIVTHQQFEDFSVSKRMHKARWDFCQRSEHPAPHTSSSSRSRNKRAKSPSDNSNKLLYPIIIDRW